MREALVPGTVRKRPSKGRPGGRPPRRHRRQGRGSKHARRETLHGGDVVLPPFVRPAFELVKSSHELNPKRALWLPLMRTLPPIGDYVVRHAKRGDRAAALAGWLEGEVERLFSGGYHAHEAPLDEFVAAAQMFYNSG